MCEMLNAATKTGCPVLNITHQGDGIQQATFHLEHLRVAKIPRFELYLNSTNLKSVASRLAHNTQCDADHHNECTDVCFCNIHRSILEHLDKQIGKRCTKNPLTEAGPRIQAGGLT